MVCPESRRSEIVAVLFPSSTSFPETKTLKRIKKENMVFHVYKFFSPEMCRLSHSDLFWKDAKTLPGCLFSGHRLLVHLCICLSWIFFFLRTILYFWRDAKRREHCQDVCLQVTLCSSLYSSCFKGKWDLSQDSIWQKKWRLGHPGPFS